MRGGFRKIAMAIGKGWPKHFKYMINNRIICNSLDGDFLRGILVDRTSTSGIYSIYAYTQPWFLLHDGVTLSRCFGISNQSGRFQATPETICEQIAPYLDHDRSVRRVVFANAGDPPFFHQDIWFAGHPHESMASRADAAAIRLLGGDEAWAHLTLHQVKEAMAVGFDEEIWQWRKTMVSALLECLERRGCVRDVLDPLAAKGRAAVRVAELKPKRSVRVPPKPTAAA